MKKSCENFSKVVKMCENFSKEVNAVLAIRLSKRIRKTKLHRSKSQKNSSSNLLAGKMCQVSNEFEFRNLAHEVEVWFRSISYQLWEDTKSIRGLPWNSFRTKIRSSSQERFSNWIEFESWKYIEIFRRNKFRRIY